MKLQTAMRFSYARTESYVSVEDSKTTRKPSAQAVCTIVQGLCLKGNPIFRVNGRPPCHFTIQMKQAPNQQESL